MVVDEERGFLIKVRSSAKLSAPQSTDNSIKRAMLLIFTTQGLGAGLCDEAHAFGYGGLLQPAAFDRA
jgi:hypothetical protein